MKHKPKLLEKDVKRHENKTAVPTANMEPCACHAPLGTKKVARLDTPCRLHVHSRRHRLVDADGVSAKAAIDGIVHAGLLPDDKAEQIQAVTYSQEKIPKTEIEETIMSITLCKKCHKEREGEK